jgi:hypothetical protein
VPILNRAIAQAVPGVPPAVPPAVPTISIPELVTPGAAAAARPRPSLAGAQQLLQRAGAVTVVQGNYIRHYTPGHRPPRPPSQGQ